MRSIILFLLLSAGGFSYGNQTAAYMAYPAKGALPERQELNLKFVAAGLAVAEPFVPERPKFKLKAKAYILQANSLNHSAPSRSWELMTPQADSYFYDGYGISEEDAEKIYRSGLKLSGFIEGKIQKDSNRTGIRESAIGAYQEMSSLEGVSALDLWTARLYKNAKANSPKGAQTLDLWTADGQELFPTQFLQALQTQTFDLWKVAGQEQEAIYYFLLSEPIGGGGGGGGALALLARQRGKEFIDTPWDSPAYSIDFQSQWKNLNHNEKPDSVLFIPLQNFGSEELSGSWGGFSLDMAE